MNLCSSRPCWQDWYWRIDISENISAKIHPDCRPALFSSISSVDFIVYITNIDMILLWKLLSYSRHTVTFIENMKVDTYICIRVYPFIIWIFSLVNKCTKNHLEILFSLYYQRPWIGFITYIWCFMKKISSQEDSQTFWTAVPTGSATFCILYTYVFYFL